MAVQQPIDVHLEKAWRVYYHSGVCQVARRISAICVNKRIVELVVFFLN